MARVRYGITLCLWLVLLGGADAAISSLNCTFEDAKRCWVDGLPLSAIAVDPFITQDPDGNHFLRITGSATDKYAILSSLPNRNRSIFEFTSPIQQMPVITSANRRQTYSWRMRWHDRIPTSGAVVPFAVNMQLYQYADGESESYGSQNGIGPPIQIQTWANGDILMRRCWNAEKSCDNPFPKIAGHSGTGWHTFKIVAEWQVVTNTAQSGTLPGCAVAGPGRLEIYYDNMTTPKIVRTGDVNMSYCSNHLPAMSLGLYGDFARGAIDVDDVQAYNTDAGPPPPGGGTTTPPPVVTPTTRYVSTTGTGTTCTSAAPCSISQVMTTHNGGDTIKLGAGTYNFECNGCLKSGSAGHPTILESATQSATPLAVGTQAAIVYPGQAILNGNTGITLWVKPEQHHITVRHLSITASGAGTNPVVQVSDTTATSSNAATDLLFENVDVTAPTRMGAAAAAYQRGTNGSARVTWDRVRIHHAGVVNMGLTNPTTNGIRLNGPDHRIIHSDIYGNQAEGISARCEGCTQTRVDKLTVTDTRIFGNGGHGVDLGESTDPLLANNLIYANGGAGAHVFGTTRRLDLYNNSIAGNSQQTSGTAYGLYLDAQVTSVVRNNIITQHDLGPIFVGSTGSQIGCSNNLTDAASGSALCANWTFNAVPANIWEDPDHATLASRDFHLKAGSVAINAGVAAICTPTNVTANVCTPALTLTGFLGANPDQGALESGVTAPPPGDPGQLIASYSFDTDFTDGTAFNNDGTGSLVTIGTPARAGLGAAQFNSTADAITIPINGASMANGFSVALSARVTALNTQVFLFGMTSNPPSYTNRVQISMDNDNKLLIGLGGSRLALKTQALFELNTWHTIVLTITPGTTTGTGSATVEFDGLPAGTATYTGLTTLSPATIGNNDAYASQGWMGQIDEVRLWNYPIPASLRSQYCTQYCVEPTGPGELEPLVLGSGQIGPSGDNVTTIQIVSGADPAHCTPLSDFQMTYAGVAQTETACSITGTAPPVLRITTAANAQAGQVVTLTYKGDEDPLIIQNQIQGGGTFDPLVFTACTSDVTGLLVSCFTQGSPNPAECGTLASFVVRDECVPVPLDSCNMTTGPGARVLTLRRVSPPTSGAVAIDLIYLPSNQRLDVANLFDPADPEIPPTTGLTQTQWRCRPDGLDASTPWAGRPNRLCEAPSPGGVNVRIAVANASGAIIPDFGTSLFVSRQDVGGNYGSFVRVSPSFGASGIRYGPPTAFGVPDGALLTEAALPVGGGLTYAGIGGFRRQELQAGRPTIGINQQLEEEYAIETAGFIPINTTFVFRAYDRVGNALTTYTGLPGCTNAPPPFGPGVVPCGAPVTIRPPTQKGR